MRRDATPFRPARRGFTLVELLVVVGIVALMVAMLLPMLNHARARARRVMCMGNLHSIGSAIAAYAADYNGSIPYGPKAAPFSPTNFYPRTGNVTSLISIETGAPCGLGLMLERQLSSNPKVLFCPDVDQEFYADLELSLFRKGQAQCDYYYRHASGGDLYKDPDTSHLKLMDLGLNSNGFPIKALAMDVNFITVPGLAGFGAFTRTCHNRENVNILFSDGHVGTADNKNDTYTVDAKVNVQDSFGKILKGMELADKAE
jgi:prepilin-type N-terminal cleavage/methylation domain-containing protein/prepilin-type processing-associated H-X9-DG protein